MKLRDKGGIWIDDHKMITEKFISNYKQRFKSMQNNARILPNLGLSKLISDLDNNELTKLPNLEELKMASFSIDSNNTLGQDGFGAGFFKNYWKIIKNDLFNCILEFFINDKILKETNHTVITLITKSNNPTH